VAMVSRPRACFAALLVAAVCGAGTLAPARRVGAQGVSEYELKAAFVYNFAKFIEWPDDSFSAPDDPFVIGVLGDDPIASMLVRNLAGKTVRERRLVTRRFGGVSELERCHILFIAGSEAPRLAAALQAVGRQPVVTVGESDGFAQHGGVVGFLMEGARLRFEVNLDAAERANLRISSQLLKLATRVLRREE
jgi:hypothetical protein